MQTRTNFLTKILENPKKIHKNTKELKIEFAVLSLFHQPKKFSIVKNPKKSKKSKLKKSIFLFFQPKFSFLISFHLILYLIVFINCLIPNQINKHFYYGQKALAQPPKPKKRNQKHKNNKKEIKNFQKNTKKTITTILISFSKFKFPISNSFFIFEFIENVFSFKLIFSRFLLFLK